MNNLRRALRGDTILNRAPGNVDAFQDGIHLDFVNNYHYTKAPGAAPNVAPLTSLFTFTRNGPATFLGRSGLIEYANENLWLQSQAFDDAAWNKARVTVTANSITAPDGTLTADTINEDGTAASTHFIQQSIATIGIVQTLSVCLKAGTRSWAALQLGAGNTTYFNLGAGLLGFDGGVLARGIEPLGSGWYRCWITKLVNTNTNALIYICEGDADATFDGLSAASMYAWGGQLQKGFNVGPYLPTTTTAKYDQPRIEYDANGNCLGLLMEASRTNLCLQSEDLATTWVPGSATISSSFGTAPDGALTSDKVVENGLAGVHSAQQNITVAATTTYTLTAFMKPAGRQWGFLFFDDGAANGVSAVFDLTNGVISKAAFNNGTGSGAVASITRAANGFFRCTVSGQIPAVTGRVSLGPSNAASPGTAFPNYTGDSSSGVEVWGVQLELGAFPSSYIPTTTVAVARTADSCIRTLGSEFSATAGTVVVAGRAGGGVEASVAQSVWAISDGGTNNRFNLVRVAAASSLDHRVVSGGVLQNTGTDVVITNLQTFKSAMAWAVNDLAASFNGSAVLTDLSMTLPTVTQVELGTVAGASQGNGHIRRFDYFPERKSNGYLQQWSRP